eukprot:c14053_g1_i1 orf=135-497(+)
MAGSAQAQGNKKDEEGIRVIPRDQVREVKAHELLDFDWKLKYAVSSDSMASVKEPIARVELSVSKEPVSVDSHGAVTRTRPHDTGSTGGLPRTLVAEYSKPQLEQLIADLEEMVQVGYIC